MKNLDEIWQDYLDQDVLNGDSLNELIWHIEHDNAAGEALTMATDMIIDEGTGWLLKKLKPYLIKQLEHEDDFIRELAVGCIVGRLKLSEYASKALDMAKNDPYDNVRGLALSNLWAVIDDVDLRLQKQIAVYLYEVISEDVYDDWHKECAYSSVLNAIKVPIYLQPEIATDPNVKTVVDKDLLEQFKTKYRIDA